MRHLTTPISKPQRRDSLPDRGATSTLSNRQGAVGSTAAPREDPTGGIRGARAAPGVERRTSQVLVFGGTSVASPVVASVHARSWLRRADGQFDAQKPLFRLAGTPTAGAKRVG